MTNNIEKLYKLAKVEKIKTCYWNCKHSFPCEECCIYKDETVDFVYPLFSNTKQLELIKWLALKHNEYSILHIGRWTSGKFRFALDREPYYESDYAYGNKDFSQALAGLVCELWEDLTEQQREEVRKVLE